MTDMSTADKATGKITQAPRHLAGDEEIRSGAAAMTESPLFTRDPDHVEFKQNCARFGSGWTSSAATSPR